MAVRVIMPKLGETMIEGTIVEWLKSEGDIVSKGDPLVRVDTDKVTIDIESPADGVLARIVAEVGAVVPVTGLLAVLLALGEDPTAVEDTLREEPAEVHQEFVAERDRQKQMEKLLAQSGGAATKQREAEVRIEISPAARRLARDNEIDVGTVTGTGPGGRITRDDILAAIEARTRVEQSLELVETTGRLVPFTSLRKTIAERMAQSSRAVARVTLTTEVDVTEMVNYRNQLCSQVEPGVTAEISYTTLVVAAVAKALELHPLVNSRFEESGIRTLDNIHLGLAVDTERGLVVPVIRDANKKSFPEIERMLKTLVEQARQASLTYADVSGGTFTVTNLGMFDIDAFTPIVNPPESGILGVGRIVEKPAVIDGHVVPRHMMWLSFSFDHRVIDGGPAARFLQTVKEMVRDPVGFLQ
jgi:pyruvate dehydrogenase E2 component (dihydrolipoamide acetyltransferase)